MNDYLKESVNMTDTLVAWRRYLHQNPEIGLDLPLTTSFVSEKLTEMGVEHKVTKNCNIIALIGKGERCFMLRSDMDALPIREESGEPFASANGNMHACGHDMHTTILLGAAKILKEHESELGGTVKLLFQSGEEVFKGASAAINEGVLDNPTPEAAFCMHVQEKYDVGVWGFGTRPMASVYGFKINIAGKGSHGSYPEAGVDPIATAVHIYLALQELISREVAAAQEATLTIGHFEAGSVPNAIPDTAMVEGTLRTFDSDVQRNLMNRINEVAESVAKTYRASVDIETLCEVPVCICDDVMNQEAIDAIHKVNENYVTLERFHEMGSEDFAFFTDRIPCSYMDFGAGVTDGERYPAHSPKARFNEEALPVGAAVYATIAMEHFK